MPVAARPKRRPAVPQPRDPFLSFAPQQHRETYDATRTLLRLLVAAPLSPPQFEALVAAAGRLASAAGLHAPLIARAQFEALHDVQLPDPTHEDD